MGEFTCTSGTELFTTVPPLDIVGIQQRSDQKFIAYWKLKYKSTASFNDLNKNLHSKLSIHGYDFNEKVTMQ